MTSRGINCSPLPLRYTPLTFWYHKWIVSRIWISIPEPPRVTSEKLWIDLLGKSTVNTPAFISLSRRMCCDGPISKLCSNNTGRVGYDRTTLPDTWVLLSEYDLNTILNFRVLQSTIARNSNIYIDIYAGNIPSNTPLEFLFAA